jgi:hypothetical protein
MSSFSLIMQFFSTGYFCTGQCHTIWTRTSLVASVMLTNNVTHSLILGFVSPCIIIYSNKSTNQTHQSLSFIACRLTFKNRVSYISDGRTATLQMLHFIYIFSTNVSTEYFKHAAHSPFFSSKCRLFHNATFFWFLYYSHFTYSMC